MREAQLTFGGRVLCPFLRPNFVSPAVYEQIRGVCRGIFRAIEKVGGAAGRGALGPRGRHAGGARAGAPSTPATARTSPTSRLDSFLTTTAYQFVELNAESPAGIAYNEVLVDVFLELPRHAEVPGALTLRRFQARERLLETLLACYREAGGTAEQPTIAIVDYEDVPTRTEHHLFREFFESQRLPVARLRPAPPHLRGRARCATRDGHRHRLQAAARERAPRAHRTSCSRSSQAARDRAVTIVNPFRCKPIHKKAIFAVLTDDDAAAALHAKRARGHRRPRALDAAGARGAHHARRARRSTSPPFIRAQPRAAW